MSVDTRTRVTRTGAILVLFLCASAIWANTPPDAPVVIEPAEASHAVDPGDVHMATAPFHDADSGDTHLCTDWEIRTAEGQIVWYAYCVTGLLAVHIHLGDGSFVTNERHLGGNAQYQLRLRFRDSSGDPENEWSPWTMRLFATGAPAGVYPLEILDVRDTPAPQLRAANDAALTLPPSTSVALVSVGGELLLSFGAQQTTNPPALHDHTRVKAIISGSRISGSALSPWGHGISRFR